MNAATKLDLLNTYRVAEGKTPFADWRSARHSPMLDAYVAAEQAAKMAEKEKANAHTKAALAKIKDDKAKLPSYKHLARKAPDKSAVGTPVQYVHQFLAANPDLSRKEAIGALIEAGVNFSTARTQYQKWFAKNKAGA